MYRALRFHLAALLLSPALIGLRAGAQVPPPAGRVNVLGASGRAVGTIDGIVSDTNLVPLQAAFISVLGTNIRIGTGPNGRFRITKVPVGQYLLIVKRVGYRPTSAVIDVPQTDTLRLAYTLEKVIETLNPVIVSEKSPSKKMAEFEERRRLGVGQFMNAKEIDARNSVYTTEIMRNFTTINVSPDHSSSITQYYAISKREGANPQLGACPMQLYVDQVPLPSPFNLDLLPAPREIAGIEVYAGASTIPPQFNGYDRGCGVILVWTKDSSTP
jgi:hypothetical protein